MGTSKGQCSALLTGISVQTLRLLARSLVPLNAAASHPLFSVAATSSLLVLLYVPRPLLPLLFSPALVATLLLLAALLRFGSAPHEPRLQPTSNATVRQAEQENHLGLAGFHQKVTFGDFVEWGRRGGPLEVIYEEYEGEEDGGESPEYSRPPGYSRMGVEGLGTLGLCYTDSDTESDDDYPRWDSPENLCFRWEEEGDVLREIALEEDNLIEIDISGCR